MATRKTNKRKSSKKVRNKVATRKKARRSVRTVTKTVRRAAAGRGKLGSILKRGIIGDTIAAVGAGVVVGGLAQRVMPQAAPIASVAAGFLAGGATGAIAAEIIKPALGMPSILNGLGGLFGGGQSNEVGAMV